MGSRKRSAPRGSSPGSPSRSPRGNRWGCSARTGRGRPRSSTSSRGFFSPTRARSGSTGRRSPGSRSTPGTGSASRGPSRSRTRTPPSRSARRCASPSRRDAGKRKQEGGTREGAAGPGEELLARTGLFDQRFLPCAQLSQGCLRRLEFARGLACRPKLLILDEIFSSLSAADEEDLTALLRAANRDDGTAFLLVSHNPPLLKSLCRRILVLEEGRIVRERVV